MRKKYSLSSRELHWHLEWPLLQSQQKSYLEAFRTHTEQ